MYIYIYVRKINMEQTPVDPPTGEICYGEKNIFGNLR